MVFIMGVHGKFWVENLIWRRINKVMIEDTIVIDHVDVSSCGMFTMGSNYSHTLT